jgi:predicted metal-dependent peptidase
MGNCFYVPLSYIERRKYVGKVYNIETEKHTYLVSNTVVHNCDLSVNCYVEKNLLPGNYVHPEQYGLPENKSAMWYYTHLKDNEKFKQQCASGQFGLGGVLSHILSSHSMWEDLKDDLISKEFAKDIIQKAKDLCRDKNYGNIPGGVIEQIDDLLKREKPVIPWAKVLRMFVATCAESVLDHTIKRISKRFGTRPGTRKADVLDLAVGVDTSGCFVGETLIPMADGSIKRIDNVKKGDVVVSSSFSGDQVARRCVRVFHKEARELVEVEARKGFSFECTPCHRVFVVKPSFDVAKMRQYDKGRRDVFYRRLRESPVVEKRADEMVDGD